MKAKNIREWTPEELRHEYDEKTKELFNLRVQQATGQLEKPSQLRALRRDVARIRTVETERKKGAAR